MLQFGKGLMTNSVNGKYVDYGVHYADTRQPLVSVQSPDGLLEGQYYFDKETGHYTFSHKDAGREIENLPTLEEALKQFNL